MSTEKKTEASKSKRKAAPGALIKGTKKGGAELSEKELSRATGGSLGKGEQKKW
jgi:hypothetical protein